MHEARAGRPATLDVVSLDDIIDRTVYGQFGDEIGRIVNVYADLVEKRLRFALLAVGGFLGIGSRRVLVPFAALVWSDGRLHLLVDEETLDRAPEWDRSNVLDPDYRAEVTAYWTSPAQEE